jgi:hypothetical protein
MVGAPANLVVTQVPALCDEALNMGIFQLTEKLQETFAESPEIFAAVQFGKASTDRNLLVIGCQVAVEFDSDLLTQLEEFFKTAWATPPFLSPPSPIPDRIIERYNAWLDGLTELTSLTPVQLTRSELAIFVSARFPPPPPNRPTLVQAAPPPPLPPNYYGHLPFITTTQSACGEHRSDAISSIGP